MKWIMKHYRRGTKIQQQVYNLNLKGKKTWMALLISFCITILLAIPMIILIISFFFLYSPVLWFYWVIVILSATGLVCANALGGTIYFSLLINYYPEYPELQNLKLRSFFIKELFHPFSVFIFICFLTFVIFIL